MILSDKEYLGSKSISFFGLPDLYYTPKMHKTPFGLIEIKPTIPEIMGRYFIRDNKEVYGYYTGLQSLNNIHGTTQVPATIEIKSNKVKEKSTYEYKHIKYIIYPANIHIDSNNHSYLELLDDIEYSYDYFEEDIVDCIKYAVKKMGLYIKGFENLLEQYSDRTRQVIKDVYAK